MGVETAVRTLLLDDAGVTGLVAARIYPVVLPQKPDYPAITYQVVAATRDYHMQGPSGLANPRLQIDLYSKTYEELLDLRDAAMKALGGFKGEAGTVPGVVLHAVFCVMEIDHFEDGLERAGPRLWRKTLDFNIWFTETL